MEAIYGAIALVLVAIVSAISAWLIARRSKSGHIDTTEAATLWDEGTKMRGELREQVTLLRTQLGEAMVAVTELNREIKASRSETEAAREETRKSRAETRQLMSQIENLHSEVKTSNALTIGALADNTETRRIMALSKDERSPVEIQHLATASDRLPQSKRPEISDDEEKGT